MKIRQVTYFLALCEEQSFTRAARRCGIAQPSLTRAIQLLEREVGGQLFERANSRIGLTELGALIYADFVRIDQATVNIKDTAAGFFASGADASDEKSAEGFARAFTSNANDGGLF